MRYFRSIIYALSSTRTCFGIVIDSLLCDRSLYWCHVRIRVTERSRNVPAWNVVRLTREIYVTLEWFCFFVLKSGRSDEVKKSLLRKYALIFVFFQALLKKMTSSNRGFPWRSASLLLLLLIGGIVAYDTQKHGSFEGKYFLRITIGINHLFASHLISSCHSNHFVFLNSFKFMYYILIFL